MDKIENQACVRNQEPIYCALAPWLEQGGALLELACGTAQHGVYMAERLPRLDWQLSEHPDNLLLSLPWLEDAQLTNLRPALAVDINAPSWPVSPHSYDFAYCANLLHFIAPASVRAFFKGVSEALKPGGLLFCYGPINENGFTSEGNASLDHWLKIDVNPEAGIKELSWLIDEGEVASLKFKQRINLPANNVILVFENSK